MIKSPYRRGADDGFIFGVYLTVMFFASILSGGSVLLTMLSGVMMAGVPLVIYMFMRSYHRSLGVAGSFAMLWMQGVVIFFCGMLIAGTVLVVYMKWINPDFVIDQLNAVASLKDTAPGTNLEVAAETARKMIDANFIPAPIDIVVEMLMLAIVTGSFLSMLLSGIFVLLRRRSLKTTV